MEFCGELLQSPVNCLLDDILTGTIFYGFHYLHWQRGKLTVFLNFQRSEICAWPKLLAWVYEKWKNGIWLNGSKVIKKHQAWLIFKGALIFKMKTLSGNVACANGTSIIPGVWMSPRVPKFRGSAVICFVDIINAVSHFLIGNIEVIVTPVYNHLWRWLISKYSAPPRS